MLAFRHLMLLSLTEAPDKGRIRLTNKISTEKNTVKTKEMKTSFFININVVHFLLNCELIYNQTPYIFKV